MQLKNILAVFAAANLVAAVPTAEPGDDIDVAGGEDEIHIVGRTNPPPPPPASFWCKGAIVAGVAGTQCGLTSCMNMGGPGGGGQCGNLQCSTGKYVAFPAPSPNNWNSYVVCSK
ncbi:uncharacterized protein BP01DRAFT_404768 [Aspergillus saccharolyticus JOP 1030-1]|uniref:Uncharacterized protein n=1 Tax=Aspergillus saccharolyticus JOP 1030-1 TaxID=1450539 RepID=A0A318Z579_9EURO|nr:hypothetical protein BP01DRAFT_404768 [Aspergillus saccharolyticus JOP 1030-1]PYH42465.1 hypothetical protein BP01DRAFT_404768 [Aspergillus saccharolyticus JOP 1030-1]